MDSCVAVETNIRFVHLNITGKSHEQAQHPKQSQHKHMCISACCTAKHLTYPVPQVRETIFAWLAWRSGNVITMHMMRWVSAHDFIDVVMFYRSK